MPRGVYFSKSRSGRGNDVCDVATRCQVFHQLHGFERSACRRRKCGSEGKVNIAQGHRAGKGLGWASGSICVLSGLFPEHMDLMCEVAKLGRPWEHEMPGLLLPLLSPLLLSLFC